MRMPIGERFPACLLGLVLPGCFSAQTVSVPALRNLDQLTPVQIVTQDGRSFRGVTGAGFLGPETLQYLPLRYEPSSWVIRFGGWPAMYTSGKYLRYQVEGEAQEIPLAEIKEIYKEKYSWGLTLISLPLTLPPGIIDFLFYNLTFGFENVDTRFDTYSRPPGNKVNEAPPF